jgi:hypothetical protein
MVSLLGLDPATHRPHRLHDEERTYVETNCFLDAVVELVAAAGHEPEAMLGCAASIDLEVDQWGFLKPPQGDLMSLYGIDLHEAQPYRRDLAGQAADWLAAGRTLMPEVDAWWLPDTVATSYRTEHVKTSIVVEAVDPGARVLRYFHNAGYFELTGEDFDGLLHLHEPGPGSLPPYVDGLTFHADRALTGEALRAAARDLLAGHLARRPADNPFDRFGTRLAADLPGLLEGDLADYHRYAFATARMAGAAFELLASHVRWLLGDEGEEVALALDEVVGGTKVLLFRLARRRAFDTAALVGPMAEQWAAATTGLDELVR